MKHRLIMLVLSLLTLAAFAPTASADLSANGCRARIYRPTLAAIGYGADDLIYHVEVDCSSNTPWDITFAMQSRVPGQAQFGLVRNTAIAQGGRGPGNFDIGADAYVLSAKGTQVETTVLHFTVNGRAAAAADWNGSHSNPYTF